MKKQKVLITNITRTFGGEKSSNNDKKINNPTKREEKMLEITKRDYDGLKYYASYTKKKIGYFEELKMDDKIGKEDKDRLIKLGWVDFNPNSEKLYHPEFFITEEGNKKVIELEKLRHEDYKLWAAIAAVVISALILAKAKGWW